MNLPFPVSLLPAMKISPTMVGRAVLSGLVGALLLMPSATQAADRHDACDTKIMTIVAHQDDDLLFASPDLVAAIQGGFCVKTVYLTAGDAGLGVPRMKLREAGGRAAYAQMAGVEDAWSEQVTDTTARWILRDAQVEVVSIRLPDGDCCQTTGTPGYPLHNHETVEKLWTEQLPEIQNITHTTKFSKESLIGTLLDEMNAFGPTEIRFQDLRRTPGDHSDHAHTALFANAAQQRFTQPHDAVGYEDYGISTKPENVFDDNRIAKRDAFLAYAQHDPEVCKTEAECASGDHDYGKWFRRQYTYDIPHDD